MSSELAIQKKPSALMALANRLSISPEKLENTLKKTVFKNCKNDEEFAVLLAVSNEYQLNPLIKQIYAFPAKGGGIEPIVSIDGWLSIINNQANFDGMTVEISSDGEEATCSIYVKGRSHPTIITEYLAECKRATEPWKQMPRRMLRHKAIMQCGRVAFGISGIYDEDEAEDINSMRNVNGAIKHETPLTLSTVEENTGEDITNAPEYTWAGDTDSKSSETVDIAPKEPLDQPTGVSEVPKSNGSPPSSFRPAFIVDVEIKKGKKTDGSKWTGYFAQLSNGTKTITAITFSKTIGEKLIKFVNSNVLVDLEKNDQGYYVKSVEQESLAGGIA